MTCRDACWMPAREALRIVGCSKVVGLLRRAVRLSEAVWRCVVSGGVESIGDLSVHGTAGVLGIVDDLPSGVLHLISAIAETKTGRGRAWRMGVDCSVRSDR